MLLGFKKLQEHGGGVTLSVSDLGCACAKSDTVVVSPEHGGIKRRHPLPEIKRDTRPIKVRVNEIVGRLNEMLELVKAAPKETPGGLLLRKPLQHMVALSALVLRDNTTTRVLIDQIVVGLMATVNLIETIKDIVRAATMQCVFFSVLLYSILKT